MKDLVEQFFPLATSVRDAIHCASRGDFQFAAFENSCVKPVKKGVRSKARILIFDIGGTRSRIVLERWNSDMRDFQILFDELNEKLLMQGHGAEMIPLVRIVKIEGSAPS